MPKLPTLLGLTDGKQSFCLSAKLSLALQDLEDLQKCRSEGLVKSKRSPQATSKKLNSLCSSCGLVPSPPPPSLVITRSICGHKEQDKYDGFQTMLEILSLVYPFLFNTVWSHSEMLSDHEWKSGKKPDQKEQWIWTIFQDSRWLHSNGKVNEPFKTILTLIIEGRVNPD